MSLVQVVQRVFAVWTFVVDLHDLLVENRQLPPSDFVQIETVEEFPTLSVVELVTWPGPQYSPSQLHHQYHDFDVQVVDLFHAVE